VSVDVAAVRVGSRDPVQELERWARLLPPPGSPVVIAVSGGADSVALWAAMARLGRWPLTIWHLDHGLRSDSRADADSVRALAERWGGTVKVERAELSALSTGIEATGRRLRYAGLLACAHHVGATVVLTAHHRDDQAETVLLNALRGAGPIGLMGIARRRHLDAKVSVVRPLLACARADLHAWLQAEGIPWREDPSNRDLRFARNRIRQRLLPAMDALVGPGIAARAWAAVATRVRRRTRVQRAAARACWQSAWHDQYLELAAVLDQPEPVRWFIWRRLIKVRGSPLERRHVLALDALAHGAVGRRLHLGATVFLRRAQRLTWEAATITTPFSPVAVTGAGTWTVAGGALTVETLTPPTDCHVPSDQAWIATSAVVPPLTLRPPSAGERWQPLGCVGSRPVTTSLAEHGVPARARAAHAVLADAAGILWIPGVGVAERARVEPGCSRALYGVWRSAPGPAAEAVDGHAC